MRFSIICAANNQEVLNNNLLKSIGISNHELIVIFGSNNVPNAYNRAVSIASEEILIFIHQDVFLPESFFSELESSMALLKDENWGIIGPIGARIENGTTLVIGDMVDRGNRIGKSDSLPEEIQTLDEMMLIAKKEDAIFDESIPTTHHMHGMDICMNSISRGKKNFAIKAFCYHNSSSGYYLPPEFFEACEYTKQKWKEYLPVATTCVELF